MDNSKKWKGSNLVLDPDQVSQSRKKKQNKFKDKNKLIRKLSYLGVGLVVVTLSIALPLTLIDTSSKDDDDDDEDKVVATIEKKDEVAVSFNPVERTVTEVNANDVKKKTVYEAQRKNTNKIKVDTYLTLLTNEMSRSDELGSFEVLKEYVSNKIFEEQEKAAEDNDVSYLSTLLLKGFGSPDITISAEDRLTIAKTEYSNSTEFLLQVYSKMIAMVYLAASESRTKNAASASLWREVWYLELPFEGGSRNTVSDALKTDLSTWNTYAGDKDVNLDEDYIDEKETYGTEENKRNGYLGFLRENSAPSMFTTAMKNRVFRSTSGDDKFVAGIQTSIDYENNERNYFVINSDDETKVAIIDAQLPNQDKYLASKTSTFDIDYLRVLLYTVVSSSTSYLTSASSYYFVEDRYTTIFTDEEIEAVLKSSLNPNNIGDDDDDDDDE